MSVLSAIEEARDTFYKEGNAVKAEALLLPELNRALPEDQRRVVYELMGLILRQQKRFSEAVKMYEAIQDFYQAGYCHLLQGDLGPIQGHWSKVLASRQNHWCISLYGLVTRQLQSYPTLFQIRHHIESDISNLILANQTVYLENLLSYVDFLAQINLEAPKLTGRALMYANMLDRAGPFLLSGQKLLPNDPEVYFHLGQYSVALQHKTEARLMLKQCLLISPTYNPAADLLATIKD